MARLMGITLIYSVFGRTANDNRTTSFACTTDMPQKDPGYAALAKELALETSRIMIPQCQVLRVVASELQNKGDGYAKLPSKRHMKTSTREAGKLPNQAGATLGFLDHVALIGRDSGVGNGGRVQIRGCFYKNDIVPGAGGAPELKPGFDSAPFDAYAGKLINIFKNHNCTLVLQGPYGAGFVRDAEIITNCNFQGVGVLQVNRKRISLEQAKKDLAKRELSDLEHELREAAYNAQGVLIALGQALLAVFLGRFQALIVKYGLDFLNRVGLPKLIKQILLPGVA